MSIIRVTRDRSAIRRSGTPTTIARTNAGQARSSAQVDRSQYHQRTATRSLRRTIAGEFVSARDSRILRPSETTSWKLVQGALHKRAILAKEIAPRGILVSQCRNRSLSCSSAWGTSAARQWRRAFSSP